MKRRTLTAHDLLAREPQPGDDERREAVALRFALAATRWVGDMQRRALAAMLRTLAKGAQANRNARQGGAAQSRARRSAKNAEQDVALVAFIRERPSWSTERLHRHFARLDARERLLGADAAAPGWKRLDRLRRLARS